MLGKASSGAHAAVSSAAEAVTRKAKPAVEQAAAMAHEVVDKASDAAAPTADWLDVQGESLNATRKRLQAQTCSYISAHPLKSIGIAVVAGFAFSRTVRW